MIGGLAPAMLTTPTVHVYVRLLNQRVEVWCPVEAAEEAPGIYRLYGPRVAENERWGFALDDLVRCVSRTFSDGQVGLVAMECIRHPGQCTE